MFGLKFHPSTLAIAWLCLFALLACSDSGEPPVVVPETPCSTSGDCGGGICVLEVCQPCADSASCAEESAYGVGAACVDGECVSCLGMEGCGCGEGEACFDGLICTEGLCEVCPAGSVGCACFGNETCDGELRCEGGTCEVCPDGAEGCACGDGDTCEEGLACLEDLCALEECVLGELGCPCREEGEGEEALCDEGLTCSDGGMCAECTPEFEGCPCDDEGACGESLVCDDAEEICRPPVACADLPCVENQRCEPSGDAVDAVCLEACIEGFEFNPNTGLCDALPEGNCRVDAEGSLLVECGLANRQCVEEGNTARCENCLPDFIDEGGTLDACRAALTCADLACDALGRGCNAHSNTADATCGEDCLDGFSDRDGVCVPDDLANCLPDDPNSIADTCTDQNRSCVADNEGARCDVCLDGFAEDPDTQSCVQRLCADLGCDVLGRSCDGEPLAECGACLEGLTEVDPNDPESLCRPVVLCDSEPCGEGEICIDREGQDALCSDWPCVDNEGEPILTQALYEQEGVCVECGSCEGTGLTGDLHPFTTENERCICATEPGFFFDVGDLDAVPCDEDGDGWLRAAARSAVLSDDPALLENARCDLRVVDRVVLENEYGQSLDVLICDEGVVAALPCQSDDDCGDGVCTNTNLCGCVLPDTLDLYESERNDKQSELDVEDSATPDYKDGNNQGRALRAAEINALTKGCISLAADLNDNAKSDLNEFQGEVPQNANREVVLFTRFSYFIETHEGRFEAVVDDNLEDNITPPGRFHIREKSRCESDFPVQYSDAIDADYWRSCTRNRDADYNRLADNALTGYDFAEWTCPEGAGGCEMPPPPTDVTPDGDEVPPHGLCEEGVTLPPVDGVWRGMNHHSQFKCVMLATVLPDNRDEDAPQIRLLSELTDAVDSGIYQFNSCRVACPDDDPSCEDDCIDGVCENSSDIVEGDADRPRIECSPVDRDSAEEGAVGFAAVRYIEDPGVYVRGCIDEWQPSFLTEDLNAWRSLCPGFVENPGGVLGQGNPGNFGREICGCSFNHGGVGCSQGCAGDQLHYGGNNVGQSCDNGYCPVSADGDDGGRRGYWMCSSWSTTSTNAQSDEGPTLDSDDGWSLFGEVPHNGVRNPTQDRVCEDLQDCGNGWALK